MPRRSPCRRRARRDRRSRSRTRRCARPGNACATSAGTCEFIAQVSARLPSAPNFLPAMKMMFGDFGSALIAVSSSRSQLMVSTPRASSHSFTPGSEKRATPITLRSGWAALARPARVGPILPPTPSTMMSPSTLLRSSISAWLGRHSNSSRAAISGIVFGRLSRESSMFLPRLLIAAGCRGPRTAVRGRAPGRRARRRAGSAG